MASSSPIDPATRKRVLKVIAVSLLLDLISFTFILPLFPKLLEFYRDREAPSTISGNPQTLLQNVITYLNKYKASFSRPIDSRYDIVLLGGALGSLFSLLQAVASPIIGHLSDRHGRRTALLASMMGNIVSVLLWVCAVDFRTFVASRVVGGLSEGNVQLATAMATDISDDASRGSTMALIGACFSIAFTFGPGLGAWLSTISTVRENPFATAAGVSLALIVTETVYLYFCLPETLPALTGLGKTAGDDKKKKKNDEVQVDASTKGQTTKTTPTQRTNSHFLLNAVHFVFLLFFSGMESSLSFMTYDLFGYGSAKNGRLLGFVGLVASLLQGGAGEGERGGKLGILRSWGQLGRGLGPILFTSVYWWAGREVAYGMGAAGITVVAVAVFSGLKTPPGSVKAKVPKEKKELWDKVALPAIRMHIQPIDNLTDMEPFVNDMPQHIHIPDQGDEGAGEGDTFDDVWGSAPASPTTQTRGAPSSLGAAIGSQAGQIIGLLEGVAHALAGHDDASLAEAAARSVEEARHELQVEKLFGPDYWNTDGTWNYEVAAKTKADGTQEKGRAGEDDILFADVADAHPLIVKWTEVVEAAVARWGIDRAVFADVGEEERLAAQDRAAANAGPQQTRKPLDW
ncbi:UPF0676 protein [Verticillium dahliae VDG2]|nr:UPF0676 protein [Verticillium dahliae VDG2]